MKTTTIQLSSITRSDVMQEIFDLLHMTKEQHSAFIYEVGCEYLTAFFGKNVSAIKEVEGRKEFWNWFKNQWYIRDERFVADDQNHVTPLELRLSIYRCLHNPIILACEIAPNRVVLGDNYIIQKLKMNEHIG